MSIEQISKYGISDEQAASILPSTNSFETTVVLPGKMYDVFLMQDKDGKSWAVKSLGEKVKNLGIYPSNWSLLEIFQTHISEHEQVQEHLGVFVIPTMFASAKVDEIHEYRVYQPWVSTPFVQYKDEARKGRSLLESQLPSLDVRLTFADGVATLIDNIYPRLPDLDFFVKGVEKPEIIVFDTSYFWYEKRFGKDRLEQGYGLSRFLFTPEELERMDVKRITSRLVKSG